MIIITGASGSIGEFLLREYLDNNENVIGTYYNNEPDKLLSKYSRRVDVRDYNNVQIFIQSVSASLTEITLINCIGISYNSFTHKSDPEKWCDVIEVNLIGTYNVIRNVLPLMRSQKFGRIINFSSVTAQKPTPGVSSYAASKAALWGLVKSLAAENASFNITANNINLGYADLGMGVRDVPENFKARILDQIPSGRLCPPQEIYNTVEFIRKSPYLNGSSIDLNGALI